jgi:hypothetical protein
MRAKKQLDKVFEFDELLEDGRLVMPSYGEEFDLFGAIALSKKLGRILTDEESKQFIRKRDRNNIE